MFFLNIGRGFGIEIGDLGCDVITFVVDHNQTDDFVHFNFVAFYRDIHGRFSDEPAKENNGIPELGIIGGHCP